MTNVNTDTVATLLHNKLTSIISTSYTAKTLYTAPGRNPRTTGRRAVILVYDIKKSSPNRLRLNLLDTTND